MDFYQITRVMLLECFSIISLQTGPRARHRRGVLPERGVCLWSCEQHWLCGLPLSLWSWLPQKTRLFPGLPAPPSDGIFTGRQPANQQSPRHRPQHPVTQHLLVSLQKAPDDRISDAAAWSALTCPLTDVPYAVKGTVHPKKDHWAVFWIYEVSSKLGQIYWISVFQSDYFSSYNE